MDSTTGNIGDAIREIEGISDLGDLVWTYPDLSPRLPDIGDQIIEALRSAVNRRLMSNCITHYKSSITPPTASGNVDIPELDVKLRIEVKEGDMVTPFELSITGSRKGRYIDAMLSYCETPVAQFRHPKPVL